MEPSRRSRLRRDAGSGLRLQRQRPQDLRPQRGLAATRRYFDSCPDLRLELISLYVASNAVLTEWRVHTNRPEELTGVPAPRRENAHPTGSRVDEFDDNGLVRRTTLYWDTRRLLRHFGIHPLEQAAAR